MKNKKWIVLLIIAFPSLFWLILETSTINSKKLPHYGTKKVIAPNDTLFYKVNDTFDTALAKFPLYAIMFVGEKYRSDVYRMAGLWEYLNYKKEKVVHIPFVLAVENTEVYEDLKKLDEHENVHFFIWNKTNFDSLAKTFFVEKPIYIDYSFFVLVDVQRNIRGFYDARYVAELKRLIEEYQHLRLKEEKQKMIKDNEIKSN
ncbi:MAG: hypothetical protein KF900_00125 [Bacteroidetes bacterium]|nr:hypothetical protein [Bacteroidota bacterium]